MNVNVKNMDDLEIRFEGRTIIAELGISNNVDPNVVGELFRHLASGPKRRMSTVIQNKVGDYYKVLILVNTDEEVEVVRRRLLLGIKDGNPSWLVCRLCTPQENARAAWEAVIKTVKEKHEQQAKPSAQ